MRFFASYKEAHEVLKLPGSWQRGTIGSKQTGLSSIKLTANEKSLDLISPDLKTVYYVGRGKKGSPGEPIQNQVFSIPSELFAEIEQQVANDFARSMQMNNDPVAGDKQSPLRS